MNKKQTQLSKINLIDLFNASLNSAESLFDAALSIVKQDDIAHVSLGLAELSLEELGKSYTCLAYYHFGGQKSIVWKDFWKDWKNHEMKAHRAYFYEFFCLIRMEIVGDKIKGPSYRDRIPHEKEISFYVDFDHGKQTVIVPSKEVKILESHRRISSLIGPLNAAYRVCELIENNKHKDYLDAISMYAYTTISSDMYQQDVKATLENLKNGNSMFDKALNDIWSLFNPEK